MGALYVFDLNQFITKYGCTIFLETGTGEGIGVIHGLKYPFKKIFSIEIIQELFEQAQKTITDPRVTFLNCDSLTGLETLLKRASPDDPILFWLDAHFPGADFHLAGHDYDEDLSKEIKLPMELEIELIKKYRSGKDVIIIDDLNHHEDGPFGAGNLPDRYRYFREKYNLHGVETVQKIFGETHDITKDYRDQGYLILTPRKTI